MCLLNLNISQAFYKKQLKNLPGIPLILALAINVYIDLSVIQKLSNDLSSLSFVMIFLS